MSTLSSRHSRRRSGLIVIDFFSAKDVYRESIGMKGFAVTAGEEQVLIPAAAMAIMYSQYGYFCPTLMLLVVYLFAL